MSPKVFIITGASKGLGAAITQRLLSQSHKVVVVARSEEPLQTLKRSHPDQVEYVAGDMTDTKIADRIVDATIKAFGQIDGLIINHSVLSPQRLTDVPLEQFRHIYDVNVFSQLAIAQAALAEIKKSKGTILSVSSGAVNMSFAAWGSYASSKSAVNVLSAHLAVEEPDITSIAIDPGLMDTDMQATIRSEGKISMSQSQYDMFVGFLNRGTLMRPEQPGNVIAAFVAEPLKELSGKFLPWNAEELAKYQ